MPVNQKLSISCNSEKCWEVLQTAQPEYVALCLEGDSTIPERKAILEAKRQALEAERRRIDEAIAYIDWKQERYQNLLSGKSQDSRNQG